MIMTKRIFINKLDKFTIVTRTRVRLVAKEYNQEEWISLMKPLHP